MHLSVLVEEAVGYLELEEGDIILDATLGGGGHALEILKRIVPKGRLIAIDKDADAIERARKKLADFVSSVTYMNDDFRHIGDIFGKLQIKAIDGALFDLGVSSYQLDEKERGFSFQGEGPLDMRMDARQGLSAKDVVNSLGKDEIADILKRYGEERYAAIIAGEIHKARRGKPIETTAELVNIIMGAVGGRYRHQKIHPACRTFQALRVYVNDELSALEEALEMIIRYLRPGGRISVISFHSLEDRIVKNFFRNKYRSGELVVITKKPVVPGKREIAGNPRARSAKLRVAEKRI